MNNLKIMNLEKGAGIDEMKSKGRKLKKIMQLSAMANLSS